MQNKTTSEIGNARYYISKYEDRWLECYNHAVDNDSDDPSYDATIEFDETANAEEVVGYYLVHHEQNPLGDWNDNTDGIEMDEQDKEVTRILNELCKSI